MKKSLAFVALGLALLSLGSFVLAQVEGSEPSEAAAKDVTAAGEEEAQTAEEAAGRVDPGRYFIFLGRTFGAALVIIGAAYGISKIGSAAVENMARQPEVAGNIQTAMIIAAALVEGITFFALIICLLELYV